ncbi:MAG: ATP-dependent sacrificial sulfur transferase LarE [Planctomycetes bacterium]|nr:ATP-dependent sacrificial sulfur transferase LarE [Planctomycetota bacterium]
MSATPNDPALLPLLRELPPPAAPEAVAPSAAQRARLHAALDALGSVAVAFSGGIDSTLLLKVAHDRLGARAVGVIGRSASLPPGELDDARSLAAAIGARLVEIDTDELADPNYAANPVNRCYFCKSELYRHVLPWARAHGFAHVADGMNADDVADDRPGTRAADEAGVRHPLLDAGFGKAAIRGLARELRLANWDKPALACLSSRVPHGTAIAPAMLDQIGHAELLIRRQGFPSVRVRWHGDVARIEVPPDDVERLFAARERVVADVLSTGFRFVALDLEGYRSGSLHRASGAGAPPR